MRMTEKEFNEWVEKKYIECLYSHYKFFGDNNITIAVSKNGKKIGVAKRHSDDNYYSKIGIAIAYTRARGQEVPEVYKIVKMSELKYGDTFISQKDNFSEWTYLAINPISKKCVAAQVFSGKVYQFDQDYEVYKI